MLKYNEFLIEHLIDPDWKGTKYLNEKETLKILETKCSDYFDYNLDKLILRSSRMYNMPFALMNPKEYNRRSANTSNYYTLIMNNDKTWEHLPKRKLICKHTTIDADKDEGFPDRGDKDVYVIIPFNDTKWGVCPKDDMWDSIKNIPDYKRLDYINKQIDDIADYLQIGIRDDNIENFKNDLKELDLELKEADDINYDHFSTLIYNFKDSGDIYQYLVDFINPNKNDIKPLDVREVYNLSGPDREVWTEGKCLMIQVDEYEKLTT